MTSFTFSAEQIRSAPPEVRQWMRDQIFDALGLQPPQGEPLSIEAELAACSTDEVVQIFQLISSNFLVTQVFFELGRETVLSEPVRQLHAVSLPAMQRHVQLDDGRLLGECLKIIDHALQKVRSDPKVSLFATDGQSHVFIHEMTFRNIRKLREQLLPAHSSEAARQASEEGVFVPRFPEGREPLIRPEYAFGSPKGQNEHP